MSSFELSTLTLLVIAGLVPGSSSVLASPANPQERQEVLFGEAERQVEIIEALAGQVRNPALSEPMLRAVRDLSASLEALSNLTMPDRIAIPVQRDPVAFHPPSASVQIGVPGAVNAPIVLQVEVPLETPTAEEVLAGHVLSDSDVQDLIAAMAEEGFPDSRLALLRTASMNAQMSVEQALLVIAAFDFGSDKVEAASLLHPRLSDPEQFYKIYGAFDFESDKDALRRRLE